MPRELVYTEPFYSTTDQTTVGVITFQLTRNLKVIQYGDNTKSIMYAIALLGGFIFFSFTLLKTFFGIFVPWLKWAETVRLIFKIDPRVPKKKRSELRMAKKDPRDLIKEARDNIKNQIWITSSIRDRIMLTIETFMAYIFSCRANKFGKIIKDGTHQIKNEMNILKFV